MGSSLYSYIKDNELKSNNSITEGIGTGRVFFQKALITKHFKPMTLRLLI